MMTDQNKYKYNFSEDTFDKLLPDYLKDASCTYFTPIKVAEVAVQWLTQNGAKKILDIGAGVGKFCITGARNSDNFFYGVEYRPSLAKLANELIAFFEIKNAVIYNSNILDLDFSTFDGFYLYNPFYENLVYQKKLNNEVRLSLELYDCYLKYTELQLNKAKPGTRLVTYHGNNFEVPGSYKKKEEAFNSKLKLWIKT